MSPRFHPARQTPTGPCGGLFDNELFTDDHGDAMVCPAETRRLWPIPNREPEAMLKKLAVAR